MAHSTFACTTPVGNIIIHYNSGFLTLIHAGRLYAFIEGQTESGYAVAKDDMGFPASLTFMEQAFNISTCKAHSPRPLPQAQHFAAGILPLPLIEVNTTSWFPGNFTSSIPATIKPAVELPNGLSSSYSMVQQGESCESRDQKTTAKA